LNRGHDQGAGILSGFFKIFSFICKISFYFLFVVKMPEKLRFNWIIRKYFGVLKYYWEIEIILILKILTTG